MCLHVDVALAQADAVSQDVNNMCVRVSVGVFVSAPVWCRRHFNAVLSQGEGGEHNDEEEEEEENASSAEKRTREKRV